MHCFKCEKIIEIIGGMKKIPLWIMSRDCYHFQEIIVLECPHCRQLIGITEYLEKDIQKQITVDTQVQDG